MTKKIKPNTRRIESTTDHWKVATNSTLIFAFLHLAFAYHMLSLILKVIGVVDTAMMLSVTLSICGIFALIYVLIFMITSRSYRRIVQM